MKGIILAGGTGTRLLPLTSVTCKQLLPVYDRPMIFYPLNTLIKAGIRDILVIVSPEYSGQFLNLLGSMFQSFDVRISFVVQKAPRGLAEAFVLGEDFMDDQPATLILGDNIFEHDFTEDIRSFDQGARIFAKRVPDPERFGVVEFDAAGRAISIEEKPIHPKSDFAIPGIYVFESSVCMVAKTLQPSARGELEITDLHRHYLERERLDVRMIESGYFDAGTHEALFEATAYVREHRLIDHFDPIINEAIQTFNAEFKQMVSLKK